MFGAFNELKSFDFDISHTSSIVLRFYLWRKLKIYISQNVNNISTQNKNKFFYKNILKCLFRWFFRFFSLFTFFEAWRVRSAILDCFYDCFFFLFRYPASNNKFTLAIIGRNKWIKIGVIEFRQKMWLKATSRWDKTLIAFNKNKNRNKSDQTQWFLVSHVFLFLSHIKRLLLLISIFKVLFISFDNFPYKI